MAKLNIEVKYSALYRPQSIGLLERQHRSLKDSMKAAIEDLVEKHQNRWFDFLPFIQLGKNVTTQQDLGVAPSELAFGSALRIPGQLLHDPEDLSESQLKDLAKEVKIKTAGPAIQTSSTPHSKPLPDNFTHVYVRQHKTTGLQAPFEGPFRVESRPSQSTVKIEVGFFKNGEPRYEIRHINDIKVAHDKVRYYCDEPGCDKEFNTKVIFLVIW